MNITTTSPMTAVTSLKIKTLLAAALITSASGVARSAELSSTDRAWLKTAAQLRADGATQKKECTPDGSFCAYILQKPTRAGGWFWIEQYFDTKLTPYGRYVCEMNSSGQARCFDADDANDVYLSDVQHSFTMRGGWLVHK